MHGVRSLPTNSTTITLGCSTAAARAILSTQSHSAVPPYARTWSVLRKYGEACSMRLSPYTSTGPLDRDGVDCAVGVDVDDDEDANPANAASAATIASTTTPRFIENTLTVPRGEPAAAGNLKPSVSCPFVPVLGNAQRYSVFWKLRTASPSIAMPSVSTMSTSVQIGTTQPLIVNGAASCSPSITRRIGSMPYVAGFRRVTTASQVARPANGKIAPDKNSIGFTTSPITIWKLSMRCIRLAITMPNAVSANASSMSSGMTSMIWS